MQKMAGMTGHFLQKTGDFVQSTLEQSEMRLQNSTDFVDFFGSHWFTIIIMYDRIYLYTAKIGFVYSKRRAFSPKAKEINL